jgi:hypothetical protein
MSYQNLPRDTQLLIIQKFDMDTRIKTKIIGKLKIPQSLIERLETYNKTCIANYKKRLTGDTTHVITLNIGPSKYYECYYDIYDNQEYWYMVTTQVDVYPSLRMIYARGAEIQ